MKFSKIALAVSVLTFSGGVLAHGYISEPASRDQMCRDAKTPNLNCGQAQYEPQSTGEGPDGYPFAGPLNGELASGSGASNWIGTALNEQSSDRWVKHKVTSGPLDFTWTFTAAHPIANYKYYITKPNWNPNQPLSRSSFEINPFCVIPGGPAETSGKATHTCDLPERMGYHVIYGAWDVSDTASTFYKVIDVEFDEADSVWNRIIGSVLPSRALETGDSVKARFFDANGERDDLSVTLTIDSEAAGEANAWSMALAHKINATYKDVRAGVKNREGEVVPVAGTNTIYALAESNIKRVEIQVNADADNRPGFEISSYEPRYIINKNGATKIAFDVKARGGVEINAKAYNSKQENIGYAMTWVQDTTTQVAMDLWIAKPDDISVVVTGKTSDGKTFQKDFTTKLVSDDLPGDLPSYEHVYPAGIGSYLEGTTVLQPATNEVFKCKKFPNSGWCNVNSHHYVPGIGSNWEDAWTKVVNGHQH